MPMNEILGLDIGGTHIRAGMVDNQNRLSKFVIEPSMAQFGGQKLPIDVLADYIQDYCSKHLGGEPPRAVSIGFPSALNKEKTVLLSTPNLPNLNGLNVVEPLREKLGIPVFIDRDVNLLLLFDTCEYGFDLNGTVIGYYVGTGLGNAIVINGKALVGKNGVAAELGHIPIKGGRTICGCGNIGCMETVVSGKYLEKIVAERYPEENVRDVFKNHSNDEVIRDYIDWIAIPLATEINIFDPDCVVLGGGVLQMAGFPTETLMEAIHRYTRKPEPDNSLKILFSSGKQESGVIGAGIYAMRNL